MKNKESGRSMVEMLGVLGIIGILSAGAMAGYSKAMFRHKVNQTIDIFNGVLQRIMELDNKLSDNVEIMGANDLISYGLLPDCRRTSNDECQLPIGTLYCDFERYESIHGELELTFHDSKSCIAFSSVGWEKAAPVEWFNGGSICIDETSSGRGICIYDPSGALGEIQSEVTISKITEACQICDEKGRCTFMFTIRSYL